MTAASTATTLSTVLFCAACVQTQALAHQRPTHRELTHRALVQRQLTHRAIAHQEPTHRAIAHQGLTHQAEAHQAVTEQAYAEVSDHFLYIYIVFNFYLLALHCAKKTGLYFPSDVFCISDKFVDGKLECAAVFRNGVLRTRHQRWGYFSPSSKTWLYFSSSSKNCYTGQAPFSCQSCMCWTMTRKDSGDRYEVCYCVAGKMRGARFPGCMGVVLYVSVFNVFNLI